MPELQQKTCRGAGRLFRHGGRQGCQPEQKEALYQMHKMQTDHRILSSTDTAQTGLAGFCSQPLSSLALTVRALPDHALSTSV